MAQIINKETQLQHYYIGQKHRRSVFSAGAIAGMIFTVVMWLLIVLGLTPRSLAHLMADRIAGIVPASFTESVIQAIGPMGKELVFYGVLIGQVFFGGFLALMLVWLWPRIKSRTQLFRNIYLLSTGTWFFFMAAVLPLLNAGFLGSTLGTDQVPLLISTFVLFQVFGVALGYLFLYLVPATTGLTTAPQAKVPENMGQDSELDEEDEEVDEQYKASRRRFVMVVSTVFIAAVGVAIGTNLFKTSTPNYRATLGDLRPDGTLEGEVTPTQSFYQVSKNAFNPKVDAQNWKLSVDGLVNNTLTFDYSSIKKLPVEVRYHTLTCISNPIGGDLIGNAQWKGTPLKSILEKAGLKPGVKRVVFTCADGYKDSTAIENVLDPRCLLVYEMNGQQLSDDHGYPARLLIPDIYGMKNAKWITGITLIDSDFEGFWQKQGWDNAAHIRTESAFVSPADGNTVKADQNFTLKGFAFAGARGIKKVEISTDNGQNWSEATVKSALSDTSWSLWRFDWKVPSNTGKDYILKVRATDGTGAQQISQRADTFPSGATGYHTISIRT